jgi:hypothetical protein
MATDAPYPELKKTHTMARRGRPWRDYKPPPSGPVWAVIQGVGSYWMLVAAIELGVFDGIERLGPTTIGPLAEALDVSPVHLQHLCDAMVSFGFLDQVDEVYELTETAERYLCTNGPASMAALVRVAPGPIANWEQPRRHHPQRAGRLADRGRPGRVLRTARAGDVPDAAARRRTARAAARVAAPPGLRVLDLGAGRAPWAIAVLESSPGSTAVVNDLPGVIDLAAQTVPSAASTAGSSTCRAISTRSISSPVRSTSSCSATCAAPRVTSGRAPCCAERSRR